MASSPRIAIYYGDQQTCGRNDGGPLYYTTILRQLYGEEQIMHLFPHGDLGRFGVFDFHLWVDWGEDALGFTDFCCPKPNAYVTSDTHLGYDYRLRKAREFDWVFCNQRRAVDDFIRDGIPPDRCRWLPHAFHPLAYSPGIFNPSKNGWDTSAVPLKRYDVCFVGNLNDRQRVEHLDALFKAFPNFYWGTQRFHEAAAVFNASRVVFNISARRELNMRIFEALGTGALLLTDRLDPSQTPLEAGVHHAIYEAEDFRGMIEQARHYIEHLEEAQRLAEAGHWEVLRRHTYAHRVLELLDVVGLPYDPGRAAQLLPTVSDPESSSCA